MYCVFPYISTPRNKTNVSFIILFLGTSLSNTRNIPEMCQMEIPDILHMVRGTRKVPDMRQMARETTEVTDMRQMACFIYR